MFVLTSQIVTSPAMFRFLTQELYSKSVYFKAYTVEPPNKGHFGNGSFVLSSEVVPISEVHHVLIINVV